jgi:hypothetical protein
MFVAHAGQLAGRAVFYVGGLPVWPGISMDALRARVSTECGLWVSPDAATKELPKVR